MTEQGLPNGLVAKTTYDESGVPTHLTYTKATNCTEKCTWLEFGAERSIYGQVLSQASLSSSQQYSYDKAGRLTLTKDTPQGGSCKGVVANTRACPECTSRISVVAKRCPYCTAVVQPDPA